ncbi:hypothetical protein QTN25_000592 [Entamoeba marina]
MTDTTLAIDFSNRKIQLSYFKNFGPEIIAAKVIPAISVVDKNITFSEDALQTKCVITNLTDFESVREKLDKVDKFKEFKEFIKSPQHAILLLFNAIKKEISHYSADVQINFNNCVVALPENSTSEVHKAIYEAAETIGMPCLQIIPHSFCSALYFNKNLFHLNNPLSKTKDIAFLNIDHCHSSIILTRINACDITVLLSQTIDIGSRNFISDVIKTLEIKVEDDQNKHDIDYWGKQQRKLENSIERVFSTFSDHNISSTTFTNEEEDIISCDKNDIKGDISDTLERMVSIITSVLSDNEILKKYKFPTKPPIQILGDVIVQSFLADALSSNGFQIENCFSQPTSASIFGCAFAANVIDSLNQTTQYELSQRKIDTLYSMIECKQHFSFNRFSIRSGDACIKFPNKDEFNNNAEFKINEHLKAGNWEVYDDIINKDKFLIGTFQLEKDVDSCCVVLQKHLFMIESLSCIDEEDSTCSFDEKSITYSKWLN